ncbi:avidin-like [Spea bombifrons]|uniref:avidin-like n=1 Tax=Spea bombifrons TaxID=233779 RepID=UPI002349E6AB|nr:avidin-like [Spea bombifrons]
MVSLVGQAVVCLLAAMVASCEDLQHEENCNLTGVWVNTLGSVLTLSVEGPKLSGSFKSSVETSLGAAGEEMIGKVVGVVGEGVQPVFAMSVSWSGGSVSTWAGQCFQGLHHSILKTTWLLRSKVGTEDKNWKATRIGEDTFHPQKPHSSD